MRKINIHDAKTHLSRYVNEAARGEEIVIAKAGKALARLAPLRPAKSPRKLGLLDGKARIPDDFDAPLPEDALANFLGGR